MSVILTRGSENNSNIMFEYKILYRRLPIKANLLPVFGFG